MESILHARDLEAFTLQFDQHCDATKHFLGSGDTEIPPIVGVWGVS